MTNLQPILNELDTDLVEHMTIGRRGLLSRTDDRLTSKRLTAQSERPVVQQRVAEAPRPLLASDQTTPAETRTVGECVRSAQTVKMERDVRT